MTHVSSPLHIYCYSRISFFIATLFSGSPTSISLWYNFIKHPTSAPSSPDPPSPSSISHVLLKFLSVYIILMLTTSHPQSYPGSNLWINDHHHLPVDRTRMDLRSRITPRTILWGFNGFRSPSSTSATATNMNSGLTRNRSAPSLYFSNTMNSGMYEGEDIDPFFNPGVSSPEMERGLLRFMSSTLKKRIEPRMMIESYLQIQATGN